VTMSRPELSPEGQPLPVFVKRLDRVGDDVRIAARMRRETDRRWAPNRVAHPRG